ncbi:MAG: MinD/ParA family protein [Nitrospirae bacterium]|nr:MinD/ParA family protein [Nitrospirota bacterium]
MDQAATLRAMARQDQISRDLSAPVRRIGPPVRVIAVTSGKGGVGKTNVVANLAIALSRLGQRVLLFDADLSLGNIDVLLGLTPGRTLGDVLAGQARLREILVHGPEGIQILPATSGVQELSALTEEQRAGLLTEVDQLDGAADVLLVDTGAGVSSNVLYFTVAAQEIIVVVSPEPTSMTDAYALMKILSTRHAERSFKLLVNSVRTPAEAMEVYRNLVKVADRFLDISIGYLGHIPADDHVTMAVRRQRAVVDLYPRSPAARNFAEVARTLLDDAPVVSPKGNIQFFWQRLVRGNESGESVNG